MYYVVWHASNRDPDQVWHLILLQGIAFGIGGGFLYYPILMLLSQWFVRRRGLAAGIIFAGSGLGGELTVLRMLLRPR